MLRDASTKRHRVATSDQGPGEPGVGHTGRVKRLACLALLLGAFVGCAAGPDVDAMIAAGVREAGTSSADAFVVERWASKPEWTLAWYTGHGAERVEVRDLRTGPVALLEEDSDPGSSAERPSLDVESLDVAAMVERVESFDSDTAAVMVQLSLSGKLIEEYRCEDMVEARLEGEPLADKRRWHEPDELERIWSQSRAMTGTIEVLGFNVAPNALGGLFSLDMRSSACPSGFGSVLWAAPDMKDNHYTTGVVLPQVAQDWCRDDGEGLRGSVTLDDVWACLDSRAQELGVESCEIQRLSVTAETCEGERY